jgi:hypothetical protein
VKYIIVLIMILLTGGIAMAQQMNVPGRLDMSSTLELRPGMIPNDLKIANIPEFPKMTVNDDGMAIYVEVEDLGTREIMFNFKDKSFRFKAEELKNLLEGRQYEVKVTVKK